MGKPTSGFVTRRGKKWYVYYRKDGKKYGRVIQAARTKTDALRYLKSEILGRDVEHLHRGDVSFNDYASKWIERKKPFLKPSVYDRYLLNLSKHIVPFFGNIKVNATYSGDIQDFIKHMSLKKSGKYKSKDEKHIKTLSPKTVNNNLMILSALFSDALDDRMIEMNPVKIRKHKLEVDRREADYFSVSDMHKFLEYVSKEYYPFFLLLWNTGLRMGEATALKWGCVDFKSKSICIEESIYRRYGVSGVPELILTKPKSKAGKRAVPLTPQLEKVLNELRKNKNVQGIDGYIFEKKVRRSDSNNFRLEPYVVDGIVRFEFKRTQRRAGLRETLTPHSIRHGYITVVRKHFPEWLVKRIIGHYTADTTDRYTHIDLKDYAPILGKVLNPALSEKSDTILMP